jgi:dephospho-CoA kinase
MLIIGLTGGIGSGKTTVAQIFEILGIPVYYADEEAKRIMNEDETIRTKLISLFGNEAYSNGVLNRQHISSIVFKDKEKLHRLNAIVHPVTIADSDRWSQAQTTPYAIKEAALIFESGSGKQLDYVIGVSAPLELRIQRVVNRDNISKQEVERRIQNQMPEEEKMKLCDFIIFNDEAQLMIPQVLKLHEKLVQGL